MKTIQEQIADLENTRAAKAARMNDVMQKSLDEGRSTDDAEGEEVDGLNAEIKRVDADLVRLAAMEKLNIAKAVPVDAPKAAQASSGVTTSLKSNVPKGTGFTRYVKALAMANGNAMQAAEIAKQWDDSTPEVAIVLRAAVAAGTTTDAAWAGPLTPYQNLSSEFIDLLRPATILGKVPGFTRVPFMVKIPVQNSGSTVQWVGESAPKPVGSLGFGSIQLGVTKAAGIVVISDELARLSTPSAEALVQSDLIAQMAQFLDDAFINPAYAAAAGVSPASVTNGVTPVAASGTTADALRADFKALVSAYTTANMSLAGGVFVMTETQATALSLMLNPLGQPQFPAVTANGGSLLGLPVITSQTVPAGVIVLVKASDILLADDGGVVIDVSREASLQMNSAPDNPSTATTVLTSLWQNNLVGIRAERFINWAKRRPAAAQYISGAAYG